MPRVLLKSEDITFMIGISTPGVAGVDQGAFLVSAQAACVGLSDEDVEQMRSLLLEIETAPAYDAYVQYKESLDALPGIGFASFFGYRTGVLAENEWHPNDPESEYFWNPIEVIEKVTIPVLAFFGERDTQVDPFESARAYQDALERAGNPNFRVELITGTDHNIILSETGCLEERNNRPLSEWTNYAPEYLDILEEWLRMLPN
jgi:pimeloyl-ACP methyl ester carboxylesterase